MGFEVGALTSAVITLISPTSALVFAAIKIWIVIKGNNPATSNYSCIYPIARYSPKGSTYDVRSKPNGEIKLV